MTYIAPGLKKNQGAYCTQTFCLVKLFKFFVCCIIIIFLHIYHVLVNKDD